jgi:phosphoserine phosphatase RsbU/P
VNRFLVEDMPAGRFLTLIYAVVDPATQKITFASAGHPSPLLVDSNGARFLEADAGMPLGIMESEYSEHEIDMNSGSRIFLYSDGVTEAANASLEDYGTDRILSHAVHQAATVQTLLNDVVQFTSGYPVSDDITVVKIARQR